MERTLDAFWRLSTAEDYLEFFGLPYDPAVVEVNRLHILKRFAGYMMEVDAALGRSGREVGPAERLERYRGALELAYRDFLTGTALDYRLFRVLRERAPEKRLPDVSPSGEPVVPATGCSACAACMAAGGAAPGRPVKGWDGR